MKYEGVLSEVNDDEVTLDWETKEPKPVGKGKHNVVKSAVIPYIDIKKAIIQLDI